MILTFVLYYLFPFIPGIIPEGVGKLRALEYLVLSNTLVFGKTLLYELIECIVRVSHFH